MKITELVMLARVMSQRYGVEVKVSDNGQASCEIDKGMGGSKYTITVPYLKDYAKYDTMIRGYLDHEIAHVLFTDFDYGKEERQRFQNERKYCALQNIFEDVYVEGRMGRCYPGSRHNLRVLGRNIFTRESLLQWLGDDSNDTAHGRDINRFIEEFVVAYTLHKRRAMLDPELEYADILAGVRQELGKYSQSLEVMLQKMDAVLARPANSTQECCGLAEEIYVLLRSYSVPVGSGNGNKTGQDICDILDEKCEDKDATPRLRKLPGEDLSDVATAFNAAIKAEYADQTTESEEVSGALTAMEEVRGFDRLNFLPTFDATEKDNLSIAQIRAALMRKIPALLQSIQYKPSRTGYTGRLSGRNLYRAGVGDGRLFMHKAERKEQRVDVALLLDLSGSMACRQHECQLCLHAMLGMLKALPKVRACAAVYSDRRHEYVCKFEDREIRNIQFHSASGTTPTAGAVLKILPQLSVHSDVRRILFVITDGEPDSVPAFIASLQIARSQGVEVYGIGIGGIGTRMAPQFGEGMVADANGVNDFPDKLAAMMQRALVKAVAA